MMYRKAQKKGNNQDLEGLYDEISALRRENFLNREVEERAGLGQKEPYEDIPYE